MTTPTTPVKRAPALLTEPVTLTLEGSGLAALNRYRQASHAYLWADPDELRLNTAPEQVARERAEYEGARAELAMVVNSLVIADRQES